MRIKNLLWLVLLILMVGVPCYAAEVSCDGSLSDCQAKIDAASDNDIITIASGEFTWADNIAWTDKNITFKGGGIDTTIINANGGEAIKVNANTKSTFRISGMTINMPVLNQGGYATAYIHVMNNSTTVRNGWRIDNIRFNSTFNGTANANHPIQIIGLTWGVIDHCTFDANGDAEQSISHYAYVYPSAEVVSDSCSNAASNCGKNSWEVVPLDLGGDSAVYVEDCTFNRGAYAMSAVNDTQYGGRMVIRNNVINNSMIMTHSAWGPVRGGMKLEVYGNTINAAGTYPTYGSYRVALIRSGTGVFFNNKITGTYELPQMTLDNQRSHTAMPTLCDGSDETWDGNTEDEDGWLCEDQPGVGSGAFKNQTAEPWYAWNNGPEDTCLTGGACTDSFTFAVASSPQVQLNRDYFNSGNTAKVGYTALTYQHPTIGGETYYTVTVSKAEANATHCTVNVNGAYEVLSGQTRTASTTSDNGWKVVWSGDCPATGGVCTGSSCTDRVCTPSGDNQTMVATCSPIMLMPW